MLSRTPHLAYRHRAKQVRMKGDEMRSRESPAPARKYIIFSIVGERERERGAVLPLFNYAIQCLVFCRIR